VFSQIGGHFVGIDQEAATMQIIPSRIPAAARKTYREVILSSDNIQAEM